MTSLCVDTHPGSLTCLREIEPMQFEQPLNHESLHLSESTMVPSVINVLYCLHEQFLARFPAGVDVELVLDRDHLRSQAFDPLEELPTEALQPPGRGKIAGVVSCSHVRRQEREPHSPVFIPRSAATEAGRCVCELFPGIKMTLAS